MDSLTKGETVGPMDVGSNVKLGAQAKPQLKLFIEDIKKKKLTFDQEYEKSKSTNSRSPSLVPVQALLYTKDDSFLCNIQVLTFH